MSASSTGVSWLRTLAETTTPPGPARPLSRRAMSAAPPYRSFASGSASASCTPMPGSCASPLSRRSANAAASAGFASAKSSSRPCASCRSKRPPSCASYCGTRFISRCSPLRRAPCGNASASSARVAHGVVNALRAWRVFGFDAKDTDRPVYVLQLALAQVVEPAPPLAAAHADARLRWRQSRPARPAGAAARRYSLRRRPVVRHRPAGHRRSGRRAAATRRCRRSLAAAASPVPTPPHRPRCRTQRTRRHRRCRSSARHARGSSARCAGCAAGSMRAAQPLRQPRPNGSSRQCLRRPPPPNVG